jgi:flavin-dependent dehydrogenase
LYQKALANGCKIIQDTVDAIVFDADQFSVTTTNNTVLKAEIVIGAFGKRSNIDQKLSRNFIQKKSPWLAVKAHYSTDFPDDLVGLHNFKGGYCGVSKVENNIVNICYLADYETFKQFKNVTEFQNRVLAQNPHLKVIFENSELLFEKPLTISQISFEKKKAVENHILMIGDTAGLIHPLCGNGMAMAIHSAKIVSELVEKFYTNEINSRAELEKKYIQEWEFNFRKRIKIGRLLSTILQKQKFSSILLRVVVIFPFLLPIIIEKTHGKPIIIHS